MFGSFARSSSARGTHFEWALVVAAARTHAGAPHAGRIADLARTGVNWDRLLALASRHHVIPLLYRNLSTVCPDQVPPAFMARLQRHFSLNIARNLALTSELIEVLNEFGAHQIGAVPFKGPTLAAQAYGGLALRQAGDLDILVRQRDAVRARNLLLGRGFHPFHQWTDDQESRRSNHFILVRDDRPMAIEIHWQLIADQLCFNLSEASLLQNPASVRLAGVAVPCFPTPELLLYLCAHGAKHCWERLSWICDIAELVKVEPAIDWDRVMDKARAIGGWRMLALGLLLAVELLEAPLDPSVARAVRADATARALAHAVVDRYLRHEERPPEFDEIWKFTVTTRERRRDRLRSHLKFMVGGLKPNERDFNFLKLPRRFWFLYHGVKPVRLAAKYATGSSRSIAGRVGWRPWGKNSRSAPGAMAGPSAGPHSPSGLA